MLANYLIEVLVFIFGLCIGSFLNCIIYRLEKNKKITGRSFCPKCRHILSWLDLFPVFSWIFLQGKCRYCNKKISIQYPIIELVTAVIFLFIASGQIDLTLKDFANLLFFFYIFSSLIIIFVYDLKHYLIPDIILFPAILITGFLRVLQIFYSNPDSLTFFNYITAVAIASGFFFLIWFISKGQWMGFGDVKLAILMGLLLGIERVLVALFLAFFLGAVIGIIMIITKKKGFKSEIPFGPFLILGTTIALFWGQTIINWYLGLFLF
jgi:prepilin signal peptidase PulO-like enzyme (type II secretory pathway)